MRNIAIFLLLWPGVLAAQPAALDSLEGVFNATSDNNQRLELLNSLTNIAFQTDLVKALSYAKRGLELADKTGDKTWQPRFCEMRGRMHANLLQLDSAMLFFDRAAAGYSAIGDRKGQATTAFKQAWVYKRRNELAPATEADLRGLHLMEALGEQEGIADALTRVAEDLRLQGRGEDGLQYALRSVEIAQKNGLQEQLVFSLREAGTAYILLKKPEKALEVFNQVVEKAQALNLSPLYMGSLLNDRGNAFKRTGRYPEAIKDYTECLRLGEKYHIDMSKAVAYANLGEVNLLMGKYAEALPYQLKTIELQEKGGDHANLIENYSHASSIYEHLGDYKSALLYQKKARQLSDSTLNVESDAKISELRTRFETGEKEATIAAQKAQISQQRTVQWLGFGVAALLAFLAVNFWRNARIRKKSNALLAAKNAENELLLKEIHHRVKNNLEVVSSLLALQSAQVDDPKVKDAMQEGQNRVQSIGIVHQKLYQRDKLAAIEMKDYFLNLSESVLDSFGADDRITIECAMEKLDVDIDTAVPLGLIVNELLTNTLKYAFPGGRKGVVKIALEKRGDNVLHLEVADNGVGKTGLTQGTGFGAQLLSLLTRQLNGAMHEEVKNGTTISFDFNLKKAA